MHSTIISHQVSALTGRSTPKLFCNQGGESARAEPCAVMRQGFCNTWRPSMLLVQPRRPSRAFMCRGWEEAPNHRLLFEPHRTGCSSKPCQLSTSERQNVRAHRCRSFCFYSFQISSAMLAAFSGFRKSQDSRSLLLSKIKPYYY